MAKVTSRQLPRQSQLHERLGPSDFIDCYAVASNLPPRKAAEIITDFPEWARLLLKLRGVLTAPFGLSSNGPPASDKVGIFPVEIDNDYELVAGFNDKHLNFRVSVISCKGHVFLATWVHPHNLAGKLYLKAILPFHIVIARNALSRVNSASLRV